ncbi:MAG: DUF2911 domain-containing protein [Bacteroidetes bacterium]|nr:DUF2911 domain-containing protein [Bacteroidota bacterium]
MKSRYFAFVLLTAGTIFAQVDLPRLSPKASVSQTIGYTNITIDYCCPGVKGRTIWGGLVPYNQVWRTGANEATTIQFTTDVTLDGNEVPAGKYSLFTIPTTDAWTVVLNKVDRQWGAFTYKQEDDLLRFTVKHVKGNFTERLQFSFSNLTDNSVDVLMNWENLQISFKAEVDLMNQVHAKVKEAIAAKPDNWQVYAESANYAADNEMFLDEALQWADKAISLDGAYYPYFVKAKVLFKQNHFKEAMKTLEKCRDAGRSDKNYQSFVAQVDFLESQIKSKLK